MLQFMLQVMVPVYIQFVNRQLLIESALPSLISGWPANRLQGEDTQPIQANDIESMK